MDNKKMLQDIVTKLEKLKGEEWQDIYNEAVDDSIKVVKNFFEKKLK